MAHMWEVLSTGAFDEWYTGLGEDAKEEVIAKVELLKIFGPQLARPHADTLNGSKYKNMKELRADTRDAVMRIAFAFDPERSAILLVGGNKAGVSQRRFYKQLVTIADALFAQHVQRIEQEKPGDQLWRSHLTNW
jgi:hypothetical protein